MVPSVEGHHGVETSGVLGENLGDWEAAGEEIEG